MWSKVSPILQRAIDYGTGEEDQYHILAAILNREKQLWMAVDGPKILGVCVTQIFPYALKKGCRLSYFAGDDCLREGGWFVPMISTIERWAKDNGCTQLEAWGRKGWERAAKPIGFDYQFTALMKEL